MEMIRETSALNREIMTVTMVNGDVFSGVLSLSITIPLSKRPICNHGSSAKISPRDGDSREQTAKQQTAEILKEMLIRPSGIRISI